jgi:hypothetical protein
MSLERDSMRVQVAFIVVLVICLGSLMILLLFADIDFQVERDKCMKIQGCDKYSCLAEAPGISNSQERNYLLQEQNCLLKEGGLLGR